MSGRSGKSNRKVPKGPPPSPQPPAKQQSGSQTQQGDIFDGIRKTIHPVLAKLEAERGHPVISYYLADGARLGDEQMLWLYEHLRRIGWVPKLSVWIYSRGGATVVPVKVVRLIREFAEEFAVLVPYRAHSSATHVAMGADEIVMTEMSELGPVDPSRNHPLLPRVESPDGTEMPFGVSVQDLRHVLSFIEREIGDEMTPDTAATVYTALFDKVHPLAIGALEQSYELAGQVSRAVLATHMDPETEHEAIEAITSRMGEHYKEHTYPISRVEARQIGLNVVDATPSETDAMWELFGAYTNLQVTSDDSKIDGQPATIARVGHIDSAKGMTLGIQLASKKDSKKSQTNWMATWLAPPVQISSSSAPASSSSSLATS